MSEFKLSKQGQELIKLYEKMAQDGYKRTDGIKVEKAFSDFELRKFRNLCKEKISNKQIKTILDYGGGGSNWDEPNFEPTTGETAKKFFDVEKVTTFEPARNLLEKKKSDCVVCMDVLEHVYIADIPNVVEELFSLTNNLLIINVACYKAAAILPNGENAHITIRPPLWWKGVIDTIAVNYKNIEIMLICSNTFKSGVIFESFKANDWFQSSKYSNDFRYKTFQ
mgnify:FL=1|tara:strand:- start:686 stop:1357 length:672 start_codon:yes stop_codon:yes gene_type:complete